MRLEVDGEIGTLTLDRPDSFNAMSPEMIGELVVAAAGSPTARRCAALIVTGDGKAFSSGGDVNWFKQGRRLGRASTCPPTSAAAPTSCTRRSSTSAGSRTRWSARSTASPRAPGFSLALMCDTRIASEEAASSAPTAGSAPRPTGA